MQTFKFITNERYQKFLQALDEVECTPETIKKDVHFMSILSDAHIPHDTTHEKLLPKVEGFLHYFCDEEEYEICQTIIDAWPELKINS